VPPVQKPPLPPSLLPLEEARVELPRRGEIGISRFRAEFNSSPKPVRTGFQESWASKPQVSCDGAALFPEIAVLSLFQKEGWGGVWVDAPRRKYFDKMPTQSKGVTLDAYVGQLLARIAGAGDKAKPVCWDLIVWHGRSVFFVAVRAAEKGGGLERPRLAWLEASLRAGMSPGQFLVVEWAYRNVVVGKRRSTLTP
jgi:hypothetical protein